MPDYFTFKVVEYLVSPLGDYILVNGERIIVGENAYSYDPDYLRIGGSLKKKTPNVYSYKIARANDDEWYLTVNQNYFVGKYPTQAAAIGVLVGMGFHGSGGQEGISEWFNNSLDSGASYIEQDANYIELRQVPSDNDIT